MVNYWELQARDVGEWMRPLMEQKIYKCRLSDGKYELGPCVEPAFNTWRFINPIEAAECTYLHKHLFDVISPLTPIGRFVPRRCQNCWKIQIRPQNLDQLFAVEALLLRLDWPSKCGVEKRKYTPMTRDRYGAYIYNIGMEQGLERLDIVREEIKKDPEIFDDTQAVLKRGCTEMEMLFYPSASWEVTDEQNRIEDLLDDRIVRDVAIIQQPKHIREKAYQIWIEWAAEIGDETYLNYTDGKRLYPLSARYERPTEEEADTQGGETVSFSPSVGEVPKGMGQLETKEMNK